MVAFSLQKLKKGRTGKDGARFLITVTVLGSAGPIRFVVHEGDVVAAVIQTALRNYAREGRRPVLGSDLSDFLLYCVNAGSDILSPLDTIGSSRSRNFVLCEKQQLKPLLTVGHGDGIVKSEKSAEGEAKGIIVKKGHGAAWKSWLNTLKITTH